MVITDVNKVIYNGDGVVTAWPYTFRIINRTDIRLMLIDTDGTSHDIESDYYVDMVNSTVYYPGYAAGSEPPEEDQPPKVQPGQKIVVYRKLPINQLADLGDKWPFALIELGLDKLTMILQDIWDWLGRCLSVSLDDSINAGDDFDPTVPLEAGKVICGNESGTGFDAREALMEVNGHWDGEGRQIKGVADPADSQDAVTKNYVDTLTDNNFMKLQPDGTAWEGRNLPISNVAGPALVKDAANKDYVDRILAGYSGQGDRFVFFDNVAQMQAAELVPSQTAVTLGYHDVNDGGAGVYTIRDKGADTPDGGSIIEITGTSYVAELINDGTVNIKQFGAYGDGTHDDTNAVNAALAALESGGTLFLRSGDTYRVSQTIVLTKPVKIVGGTKENTTLLFDKNGTYLEAPYTCGIVAVHTNTNIPGYDGDARRSLLFGFTAQMEVGIADMRGVVSACPIYLNEVDALDFSSDGFAVMAGSSSPIAGNANGTTFQNCTASGNAGNGFYFVGDDANACVMIGARSFNNGGWGFYDDSLLGNTYTGCETDANTDGGYFATGSKPNRSTYVGCYAEGNQTITYKLGARCVRLGCLGAISAIYGGQTGLALSSIPRRAAYFNSPVIVADSDQVAEVLYGGAYTQIDKNQFRLLASSTSKLLQIAQIDNPNYVDIYSGGVAAIRFPNSNVSKNIAIGRPYFNHGLSFGGSGGSAIVGSGGAAPTTGTYDVGAIVFNDFPSPGEFVGWICTTAGTPGTWKGFGTIEA